MRRRAIVGLLLLLAAAAVPVFADNNEEDALSNCEALVNEEPSSLHVYCALLSGNLSLIIDENANSMTITCDENGSYTCEELRDAQPFIHDYITSQGISTNRVLDYFKVLTCVLPPEQLSCPLSFVGANDTVELLLDEVVGAVQPLHVEGMTAVKKIFLKNKYGENITTMPYEALSKLPFLNTFSFSNADLVLAPDADHLPRLEKLKQLRISYMGRMSLPRGAFRNIPNLEFLHMEENNIEYIDEDAFIGLPQLANINLLYNQIVWLPPRLLRHCPRVVHLDVSYNDVERLPAALLRGLEHLREVTMLGFAHARGGQMYRGVFSNLPSLYHVTLNNATLATLSKDMFTNSTALQQLNLSWNLIWTLPSDIFRDQKLREVFLAHNNLDYLPGNLFSDQDTLEQLDLSYNGLRQVERGLFHNTVSLKFLYLNRNKLKSLENSMFRGLSQLRELDLSDNRIQRLNMATFEGLNSLETLWLARNELLLVCSSTSTSSLNRLRSLDLNHNRVTAVCSEWRFIPTLEKLDLSHNRIEQLSRNDTFFSSNAFVNLRYNLIRHIQPHFYSYDDFRPTFLIDKNYNFVCDCRLYDFSEYIDYQQQEYQLGDATCSDPPSRRNTPVAELQAVDCSVDCPKNCMCALRLSEAIVNVKCPTLPRVVPQIEGFSTRLCLSQAPTPDQSAPSAVCNIYSVKHITEPLQAYTSHTKQCMATMVIYSAIISIYLVIFE